MQHAISSLWGVVAVALPATLLAWRISLGSHYQSGGISVILFGEILKICATVIILYSANQVYSELVWWPLICAVIFTLKSYILIFFTR